MALGKELGSVTYKVTTTRYSPGPGKGQTVELDMGGPVSNFGELNGTGQGTLTVVVAEPGAKAATWSWCGALYTNKGDILGTGGQGTIEESGKLKWRLRGVIQMTDGSSYAAEGDADFATQTISWKALEWS